MKKLVAVVLTVLLLLSAPCAQALQPNFMHFADRFYIMTVYGYGDEYHVVKMSNVQDSVIYCEGGNAVLSTADGRALIIIEYREDTLTATKVTYRCSFAREEGPDVFGTALALAYACGVVRHKTSFEGGKFLVDTDIDQFADIFESSQDFTYADAHIVYDIWDPGDGDLVFLVTFDGLSCEL